MSLGILTLHQVSMGTFQLGPNKLGSLCILCTLFMLAMSVLLA